MIIPSVEQLDLTWEEGTQMLLHLSHPLLVRD
jgi:hypothetical protein